MDFEVWEAKLKIVGADLRAAIDVFNLVQHTKTIVEQWGGRLYILINNAAQTLTDSTHKEEKAITREALLYGDSGARQSIVGSTYAPRVRGGTSGDNLLTSRVGLSTANRLGIGESRTEVPQDHPSRVSDLHPKPEGDLPSSWVQSLSEISYEDVISAQSVNAIVPLISRARAHACDEAVGGYRKASIPDCVHHQRLLAGRHFRVVE